MYMHDHREDLGRGRAGGTYAAGGAIYERDGGTGLIPERNSRAEAAARETETDDNEVAQAEAPLAATMLEALAKQAGY